MPLVIGHWYIAMVYQNKKNNNNVATDVFPTNSRRQRLPKLGEDSLPDNSETHSPWQLFVLCGNNCRRFVLNTCMFS